MTSFDGEIKDPSGNRCRGFTAEGVLYRKDFWMTWNQILDTVDVLVGHKVEVMSKVEVVGNR